MCYFDLIPKVRDVRIPRSRAIRAWRGFGQGWTTGFFVSPYRRDVWQVGVRKKATAHGFYATVKKPTGYDHVKRVLLWGRVREYKGALFQGSKVVRHGYRAQFCMILPAKKRKAR